MNKNMFVFTYLSMLAVDLSSYPCLFIGVKSLVFVNILKNKPDYYCYLLKDAECEFTIGA